MIRSAQNQELISRMKLIAPKLKVGYLNGFLRKFAQYDTRRGRNKIEAVMRFKLADKGIIDALGKYIN